LKKIQETPIGLNPIGITIDEQKNLFYIAGWWELAILNTDLKLISTWRLPSTSYTFRGLQINNNILFLTTEKANQIFLLQPQDGKVLQKWGIVGNSSKPGEFNDPHGITLNNAYAYICDSSNHRIQLLNKKDGKFIKQWGSGISGSSSGQFCFPQGIYYHISENIFYIGDQCSVQLYTREEKSIERLGGLEHGNTMNQFFNAGCICVMNDQLCISDTANKRVQIFKRTE